MTPQLSFVYGPTAAGAESWEAEREALRAAIALLGPKEVAYALDVGGSALSDALNERDRKRLAGEWSHVVIAMLMARGDDIAIGALRTLVNARMGLAPFATCEKVELTPEEKCAAYERELRRLGDDGKKAIARVTGKVR